MGARPVYDHAHRKLRAALLPSMPGTPCTRCHRTLQAGDDVHLDHLDDGSGYAGFACARCNEGAGGRKAGRSRRENSGTVSRAW